MPPTTLIINSISLNVFTQGQIAVSWTIENTTLPVNQFQFFVERSGSPEGPFTRLNPITISMDDAKDLSGDFKLTNPGFIGLFEYTDSAVNTAAQFFFAYYRVAVRDSLDNETFSEPKTFYEKPDLIGLEIARRNQLLLDRVVGVKCVLHKRKHWGERCLDCWDVRLQRTTKSTCISCFGTGYKDGYWKPIQVKINFSPSQDIIQQTIWGKLEEASTSAWLANYPLAEPQDVVTELTRNRRWAVKQKHQNEKNRVPIKQILQIEELEKSRIEYSLPIG